MNRSVTFGIIGGSGNTGKAVARELRRSSDRPIVIGARNLAKAQAVAHGLPNTSAMRVDACDAKSLENFCAGCSVVVNCAGPVCELQDAVAQTALRTRTHYVDVAGLTFVRERMAHHHQELADHGLSCVVSAGWLPGMTELLPAYALAVAKPAFEVIESLTIHFGDSGDWSQSAMRDMLWYLRKYGRQRPRYRQAGRWVRASLSEALVAQNIESSFGHCLFAMSSLPELVELFEGLSSCDARAYTYLPSRRAALAGSLIAVLKLPDILAAWLFRPALLAPGLPVGGFAVVQIQGRSNGTVLSHRHQVTFERGREYWMNGVVAASAARLIADHREVKTGVHFLFEAVDPISFMEALRRAGVTHTQSFSEQGAVTASVSLSRH